MVNIMSMQIYLHSANGTTFDAVKMTFCMNYNSFSRLYVLY